MDSHAIAVGEGELVGDYSGDDFGRAFNFVAGCSSTPHVGPTIDTGRNTTAELATPAVATPTLAPIQPQCCACGVGRFHTSRGRLTLRLRRLAEFLLH